MMYTLKDFIKTLEKGGKACSYLNKEMIEKEVIEAINEALPRKYIIVESGRHPKRLKGGSGVASGLPTKLSEF